MSDRAGIEGAARYVAGVASRLCQLRLGRYIVQGLSMWPTLCPGDRLLVLRGASALRQPRHGDLVLARPTALHGRVVLKRVGGVLATADTENGARFVLLGDNPAMSTDSRDFGPVTATDLRGLVLLRYWPEERRGRVR